MRVKGVYTALVTPVIGGEVSAEATNKLVDHVLDNGCAGLVALGGTGEYCALSDEQRVEFVRFVMAANRGRAPVIAGIIGPGLPETIEMGNKCKELGVDALMVVTPYYVIANQQGIIDYYETVVKEVKMPLVLYNIPYRTSVNMLPESVEKLLDRDKSGQIIGIKECCQNMGQALELLCRVKDRISFICGEEFLFLTEVACGAEGAILATSNLVPKIWTDLFNLVKSGNLNRSSEIVIHLIPLLRQVFAESNPGPLKQAMKMIGIDCGDALNPLTSVSAGVVNSLKTELTKLLEWYKN
jgi:4-hydroxy-tetrahydrodipicolinate synthase